MLLLRDDHCPLITGLFHLSVLRRGRLIEEISEPNLVVNGSKQIQAQLLGGNTSGNTISQIGYGTSLTAPVVGNTGLTSAYMKALDSVTYPTTGQVQFNFSLGSGEANGVAIGEFGLFSGGGALYARKVRSAALNKASDISFTGSWTIVF
jgi:hypothetical protein